MIPIVAVGRMDSTRFPSDIVKHETRKIQKMRKNAVALCICMLCCMFYSYAETKPHFEMRGIVVGVRDLKTVDWPALAADVGINTIGTHIYPEEILSFIQSKEGKDFLESCRKHGIAVEHQLHSLAELLPRVLYADDPSMFRMNEEGQRVADFNCCASSKKALDIIARNALKYAKLLPPSNHRYYFWLDDGAPTCKCPDCSKYTSSEQALLIENEIIKLLKTYDPQAELAHLAYAKTLSAPEKVKPEEGIFLEFAPIYRTWEKPLADASTKGRGMSHSDNLKYLYDNLKVFPADTAVVLEYWLDASLFSNWEKPAVKIPWHREVFESDIDTYAKLGIKNITSFGAWMDADYFKRYPDAKSYLKEYGEGLNSYKSAGND